MLQVLQEIAAGIRAYPVALARQIAAAKVGDGVMAKLNHRYSMLTPAARLECAAELHAIRRARRGETLAEVH